MVKVLVFAMLSTASGWGLPNEPLLELNEESTSITVEVDGARDRRQARSDVFSPNYMLPKPLEACGCDLSCDSGCDGDWRYWGNLEYWTESFRSCDDSCDSCLPGNNCNSAEFCESSCRATSVASVPATVTVAPLMPLKGAATGGEAPRTPPRPFPWAAKPMEAKPLGEMPGKKTP